MKRFRVTVPFLASVSFYADAESEEEAINSQPPEVFETATRGLAAHGNARLSSMWPDSALWDRAEAEEVFDGPT